MAYHDLLAIESGLDYQSVGKMLKADPALAQAIDGMTAIDAKKSRPAAKQKEKDAYLTALAEKPESVPSLQKLIGNRSLTKEERVHVVSNLLCNASIVSRAQSFLENVKYHDKGKACEGITLTGAEAKAIYGGERNDYDAFLRKAENGPRAFLLAHLMANLHGYEIPGAYQQSRDAELAAGIKQAAAISETARKNQDFYLSHYLDCEPEMIAQNERRPIDSLRSDLGDRDVPVTTDTPVDEPVRETVDKKEL